MQPTSNRAIRFPAHTLVALAMSMAVGPFSLLAQAATTPASTKELAVGAGGRRL